ncbi:Hypothetical predicted protein, partial [Paramuricea clavata]
IAYHREATKYPKIVKDVDTMLMFIGYPRSGHTLIGSLLDAHPNIVVANEYNILANWENYTTNHIEAQEEKSRQAVLLRKVESVSYTCGRWSLRNLDMIWIASYTNESRNYKIILFKEYLYARELRGASQSQNSEPLINVIGDKEGGRTTKLFQRDSQKYLSMLQEIRREVKIPIKFLHVVRNPFDNMATLALRRQFEDSLNWTKMYESPVLFCRSMKIGEKCVPKPGVAVAFIRTLSPVVMPEEETLLKKKKEKKRQRSCWASRSCNPRNQNRVKPKVEMTPES